MRETNYSCAACEQIFGSKWALTEHAKSCPVKRNAELARIQETLAWKQARIERSVNLCYRYSARAFTAHHTEDAEATRRFAAWFSEEFHQLIADVEQLRSGVQEASKLLFPRLDRMKREVGTLIEQVKDLAIIGAVLSRFLA